MQILDKVDIALQYNILHVGIGSSVVKQLLIANTTFCSNYTHIILFTKSRSFEYIHFSIISTFKKIQICLVKMYQFFYSEICACHYFFDYLSII